MRFLDSAPDPKQIRALKFFLLATLAVGAVASLAAGPLPVPIPSWAIAPLCVLSYGLMAVGGWLAWKRAGLHSPAMALYAAQLALNLVWRFWPVPLLGMAMDLAMLATLILFARRNFVAALTFLPCLIWSLFVSLPMNALWRLS
ncbi:MAG TPA: TspO/MBR family protein [Rhizomicrobium sp.]|jgi:tryptophan-rich sensory protein|nr:TspO/MBR family protein [Rhizomicrobium sp.]